MRDTASLRGRAVGQITESGGEHHGRDGGALKIRATALSGLDTNGATALSGLDTNGATALSGLDTNGATAPSGLDTTARRH